jgi:signal transduction histidine kinase
MNLIRNSVLAYREKSLQGNVDINAKIEDNMCVISVTDTAGGIPEEVRDTIFKKILTTRGTKGTGLGLYLAAGIIEGDFKGTISFDTETGRGTTFYIRIPMDKGDNE